MARGNPVVYSDFSGGVNLAAAPYLLAENQCQDARNLTVGATNSLRKRPGNTLLSEPSTLDSIHSLFPANVTTKVLLAVGKQASASNDRIIKIDTGGTATTLVDSLTQGQRWEWVQAPTSGSQGPIYGVNGVDPPKYLTMAGAIGDWTASTGTIPTTYKYLLYHADTIWATGSSTYPGRVQYSGLTGSAVPAPDPRDWNTDHYVDIEPQDGQLITGIGKVASYILVFKPHNTYAITDPSTGAWRQVNSGIGCAAHRSIVETQSGTIFLSEDAGVCMTDGSNVYKIGENVDPLIRQAAENYPTALANACGAYRNDSYYLSIPTASSSNDLTLEYHLPTKSWWIHTFASNQFALLDPNTTPKLYSAHTTDNKVLRALVPDTYADENVAYSVYWEGPFWPFGQPHINKRLTQVRMDGAGIWLLYLATTFEGDYELIDGIDWEVPDAGTTFGVDGTFRPSPDDGTDFGPEAGILERRYPTPGSQGWGRALSLKLTNYDPYSFELYPLPAFVRERKD